jgi:murein DD-endopeptidase MepM/ murein hydrolase activator NlpD
MLGAGVFALLVASASGQTAAGRSAQPGDVVKVEGTATVFGKAWHGLIGIDLDTKPGTYRLMLDVAGRKVATTLRVLPKQFAIRRLRVSPEFVNPPAEALEQIVRDNKKTGEIFQRVAPRHWQGPFVLPVDGQPTGNFGTRSYYNGQRRSPHAGVDFLSATGTPIRAANHGVVALAEPLYFTGNTVIIDYGDRLFSLFAHLSEFRVHEGDIVNPDTIVGLVGATGRVTGPHLHWAVRLQGARVDPISLVAAGK